MPLGDFVVDIYKWCNWYTSLGDFVVTMKIRYCLCSICFMLDICTVFIKYVSYNLKYLFKFSSLPVVLCLMCQHNFRNNRDFLIHDIIIGWKGCQILTLMKNLVQAQAAQSNSLTRAVSIVVRASKKTEN